MICFTWSGFPQYAARCIKAVVRATDERIVVVGTKPKVPVVGMEAICGCEVQWIDQDDGRAICDICREMPRVLFSSGWSIGAFNRFCNQVRSSGGKVVAMCDNNWMLGLDGGIRVRWLFNILKELMKSIRFRIFFRSRYDLFFVPGESGKRLLRFYDVEEERIFTGMYSADADLFSCNVPLAERPKRMIFVGRYVEQKNVMRLIEGFARAILETKEPWELEMHGCGVLWGRMIEKAACLNKTIGKYGAKIVITEFVQPEELSSMYQRARVFCLPSLWEHWGLVVHEAALSGCVLLLSCYTGSALDFLAMGSDGRCKNGASFYPYSIEDIKHAIVAAFQMDQNVLSIAQAESTRLAKKITTGNFAAQVLSMINYVESKSYCNL